MFSKNFGTKRDGNMANMQRIHLTLALSNRINYEKITMICL